LKSYLNRTSIKAIDSEAPGHLAAIDPNFCAQHDLKADWASECARRKFIAMPDPGDL